MRPLGLCPSRCSQLLNLILGHLAFSVNPKIRFIYKITSSADQPLNPDTQDIKAVEHCLNQHFNGALMTQKQFDAMVSLGLNVGCGNLKTYYSTRLGKRLQTTIHKRAQAKQFAEMCERITDFDRSGGRKVRGLTIRRQEEKALCLK